MEVALPTITFALPLVLDVQAQKLNVLMDPVLRIAQILYPQPRLTR